MLIDPLARSNRGLVSVPVGWSPSMTWSINNNNNTTSNAYSDYWLVVSRICIIVYALALYQPFHSSGADVVQEYRPCGNSGLPQGRKAKIQQAVVSTFRAPRCWVRPSRTWLSRPFVTTAWKDEEWRGCMEIFIMYTLSLSLYIYIYIW